MPNNWINRTIEEKLLNKCPELRPFPIYLFIGPRQVGKSSLLKHCAENSRQYVDLDDLGTRTRATQDPETFVAGLRAPLIIDEIQYAPQLLSHLKQIADAHHDQSGVVWLTGSQNFSVMQGVSESLAGRVAILNLFGLSDEEKELKPENPEMYFGSILESSFPKMRYEINTSARDLYLSSYLQTYIQRDIRELHQIEKRREFEIFVKMCALRSGHVINYDELAKDVGVSPKTIKEWLSLLEDSFLIVLLQPFHSNLNKRLIKSPKLYFLDSGLAAYLSGWREATQARLGPQGGSLFETHIFGQLFRYFKHHIRDFQIYFWRTRDGQEIDFLVKTRGKIFPIEVKLGRVDPRDLVSLGKHKNEGFSKGHVISLLAKEDTVSLNEEWNLISPFKISNIFSE